MHYNFEDNYDYMYRNHVFEMLKKQAARIADKLDFWKSIRLNVVLPQLGVHSFVL